jgi:hypothetical protein
MVLHHMQFWCMFLQDWPVIEPQPKIDIKNYFEPMTFMLHHNYAVFDAFFPRRQSIVIESLDLTLNILLEKNVAHLPDLMRQTYILIKSDQIPVLITPRCEHATLSP